MSPFIIFSDTACDLPPECVSAYGIRLVPYYVSFDGVSYYKEGVDITNAAFYETLRKLKVFPKTSLPSVSDYEEAFTPYLAAGTDVLCLCLSSKFSGSFQSALMARENLQTAFPERSVQIIDSMQASAGQGQLVLLAARLREAGKSLAETRDIVEQAKVESKIYVTVDSLEYLQRGGRIGKVSALAGGLLGIKPVIAMEDGELVPRTKVRGRKKAVSEIIDLTLADIGGRLEEYDVTVIQSDCLDEALRLKAILKERYSIHVELPPFELGVTIGAHIGPTVLAISYAKKIL